MSKKFTKEQILMGILAAALLFIIAIPLPKEKKEEFIAEETAVREEHDLETRLKAVLEKIAGVGKAEVFVTYEDQGKLIVEKDEQISEELVEETDSSGGKRTTTTNRKERETVYDEREIPYVIQELSPTVKGVLVVAQGGDQPSVKKKIQQTIEALFGLESHKISIMKMEVSK